MLLRVGAGVPLICKGIACAVASPFLSLTAGLGLVAAVCGVLLLLGLWTPLAGTVVVLDQLSSTLLNSIPQRDARWIHILLAVLAAGIAMLGPGAWSADARVFGRKRFR